MEIREVYVIEDEFHFNMLCLVYQDFRRQYLRSLSVFNYDSFVNLMSKLEMISSNWQHLYTMLLF